MENGISIFTATGLGLAAVLFYLLYTSSWLKGYKSFVSILLIGGLMITAFGIDGVINKKEGFTLEGLLGAILFYVAFFYVIGVKYITKTELMFTEGYSTILEKMKNDGSYLAKSVMASRWVILLLIGWLVLSWYVFN